MKQIYFFILMLFAAKMMAQTDCSSAITICGNTDFDNLEINGFGMQEISSCGSEEHNSLWLKLNIGTSGTLEFTIIPQSFDLSEDFDFFLYSYIDCDNLTQVRCSTTNPMAAGLDYNSTGVNEFESDQSEGPDLDGNSYVQSVPVLAGETYMLVIDRPMGNSNFSIEWTGSAMFNEPPQFMLPASVTSLDIYQCDIDGVPDGSTAFNLLQNSPLAIGSQTGVSVTYYTNQSDCLLGVNEIPSPNAFINTLNPQTIYVRIENDATECFNTSEFEIGIDNEIHLDATESYVCDDAADGNATNGHAIFNMDAVTAEVFPAFTTSGFTVTYYLTQTDADNNINPLPQFYYNTVANQQTVFIKIQNGTCGTTQPINLVVKSFAGTITANLRQCDFGTNQDGITLFNLSEADVFFTNADPNLRVDYFENAASLANDTPLAPNYTNTSNPQTIIAKLTDITTGCSISDTLILNVNTVAGQPVAALQACDVQENGFGSFDLTQANVPITAQQVKAFYGSLEDALLQQNEIANITNYTNPIAYHATAFVRIDDIINGCSGISEFDMDVIPLPDIEEQDEAFICINQPGYQVTIDAGLLDAQPYAFEWYFNGSSLPNITHSIAVGQIGTYTVDIINAYGCRKTRTIQVLPSDVPTIDSLIVEGSALENNSVTVNVSSTTIGTPGFSLDYPNGPFQSSNLFSHVSCGMHTIYVNDEAHCGVVSQSFEILNIPAFFTPNGDGYDDTWNMRCAATHPGTLIYIFDRFGKLIQQISAAEIGWDGTFNGRALPSDDYWYVVKSDDGKTSKGHFTLKR